MIKMPKTKKTPDGALETFPYETPLWCVYGHEAFPQIICCKISNVNGCESIWGYSIWKRKPGFRTLGLSLSVWLSKGENMCWFFDDQAKALAFLAKITTPKKAAL